MIVLRKKNNELLNSHVDDSTIHFTENSIDKYTVSEVDGIVSTVSGTLQSQITYNYNSIATISGSLSDKSDVDHTHDDRYYTETETDNLLSTLSGTIISDIPTDFYTTSEVDALIPTDFYTQSEVATISGTLQSSIDGKADTDHNHSGVYQPVGDYVTDVELSTLSGTLQTVIDGKSDISHNHNLADLTEHSYNSLTDKPAIPSTEGLATEEYVNTISGSLQSQINTFDPLPDQTDNAGKFLTTDGSDASWATISGGTEPSDHSELANLSYEASGHMGFASSSQLTAVSGSLQISIDGKADISHTHVESDIIDLQNYVTDTEFTVYSGAIVDQIPTDFYTTSEVDALIPTDFYSRYEVNTISGALQADIDEKAISSHTHLEADITDLDKYTTSDIDVFFTTLSGALQSEIDTKSDTSHTHVESDISDLQDYLTDAEFTVYSGTLQNQIDSKQDSGDYVSAAALTTLSGSLQSEIDAKSDTSHNHNLADLTEHSYNSLTDKPSIPSIEGLATENYVNTVSGVLQTQIDNLDYATDGDILTLSGVLQSNIDTKSNIGHIHVESDITDLDKYTQAEVTTISGNIVSQIPTDFYTTSEVNALIPTDFYSRIEVDTISGSLQVSIDDKADTDHNHDGVYQPAGDYVTESEFTTYSGTIVSQIPTDFYTTSEVDALIPTDFYSKSEVDTISGSLQSETDSKADISHTHTESDITDLQNYVTETEFTVYSGTLQSAIDEKSDVVHTHDDRYYTETEADLQLITLSGSLQSNIDGKEDSFSKNSAFNKNFGTSASEVCEGNDSRLSDARVPVSHNNTYHSQTYITSTAVTYENLNSNGDVGIGADQVAVGNHSHAGGAYSEPVLVHSGGGDLTAYRINEIQDSNYYTLPPASGLIDGGWVVVRVTDTYSAQTPTVSGFGSDTISYSGGYDTSILVDLGFVSMWFISNGTDAWRL